MQTLLTVLIGLCDFFCFLCSKREKLETRLMMERGILNDRRNKTK